MLIFNVFNRGCAYPTYHTSTSAPPPTTALPSVQTLAMSTPATSTLSMSAATPPNPEKVLADVHALFKKVLDIKKIVQIFLNASNDTSCQQALLMAATCARDMHYQISESEYHASSHAIAGTAINHIIVEVNSARDTRKFCVRTLLGNTEKAIYEVQAILNGLQFDALGRIGASSASANEKAVQTMEVQKMEGVYTLLGIQARTKSEHVLAGPEGYVVLLKQDDKMYTATFESGCTDDVSYYATDSVYRARELKRVYSDALQTMNMDKCLVLKPDYPTEVLLLGGFQLTPDQSKQVVQATDILVISGSVQLANDHPMRHTVGILQRACDSDDPRRLPYLQSLEAHLNGTWSAYPRYMLMTYKGSTFVPILTSVITAPTEHVAEPKVCYVRAYLNQEVLQSAQVQGEQQ